MPKLAPRKLSLETPSARAKLAARKPAYFVRIAPSVALGYRRNASGFGSWSVRFADGTPGGWLKKFGDADDLEPANDRTVFSFDQAIVQARKLARGEADADGVDATAATGIAPISLGAALDDYQRDLESRGGSVYNATSLKRPLPSALLAKPVAMLTSKELRAWRDGLLAKKLQPSSVSRYCKSLRAALSLCARRDPRIKPDAWASALESLPGSTVARNIVLADADVSRFVAACYQRDAALGLLTDVLATVGCRVSQAARLLVSDLHGGEKPRLTVSKSGKGGSKNRAARKLERISVPITSALAAQLKQVAKGRPADAVLLLQSDGTPWNGNGGYRDDVKAVVMELKLDPKATMNALRHSGITRGLLRGLPIRVIAALTDTSAFQIEATYSKHIADHSDDLARSVLLHHEPARDDNVVRLAS